MDLNVLLEVIKKQFESICPECIDVMFDVMVETATKAFSVNSQPLLKLCCDDCCAFFKELFARENKNNHITTESDCLPGFVRTPFKQCCTFCRSNCCPCSLQTRCCNSPVMCQCRFNPCYPCIPCTKKSSSFICSAKLSECSTVCSKSVSPCCKTKSRKRKKSKNDDRFKPKSVLVEKQIHLRKQVNQLRKCLNQCKCCASAKPGSPNLEAKENKNVEQKRNSSKSVNKEKKNKTSKTSSNSVNKEKKTSKTLSKKGSQSKHSLENQKDKSNHVNLKKKKTVNSKEGKMKEKGKKKKTVNSKEGKMKQVNQKRKRKL
ncbi:hypothetical protein WDU94_002050 [Cyamophila willieti]